MGHNCRDCKSCHIEIEGWEMPHIYWFECSANPWVANLKSFPFKSTDCILFEQNNKTLGDPLSSLLTKTSE